MKKYFLVYLLVALAVGVVYFPMLAPSVAPQGDSGELVTTAYFLGVAHPPGYPVYILLGNLFSKLPFGEVAWRINLMSMALHLLSLSVVAMIVRRITANWVVAVGAALILAFSYNFWLYSLVAEVFPLNNFLALIILYLAIDVYCQRGRGSSAKKLYLLSFTFGLGLANHQTIVFLAAPVLVLLWPTLKQNLLGTAGWKKLMVPSAVVGLLALSLPYVFFFVRAKYFAPAPASWVFPDSLSGLINLFFRGDYGTFAPTSGMDPALARIADKIDHVVNYFRFALDDFGWVGMAGTVFGAVVGWKKYQKITMAILAGLLLSSVVFLSYANFPYRELSGTGLEIIERFYLLPNLFLVLLIGIGLSVIFNFAGGIPVARLLCGPLLMFYVLSLFINHYLLANQSGNFLAANLGKNILSEAAPNSLIVLQGDVPTFVAFYQRYVQNIRPDIEFLTPNQVSRYNRYKYLRMVRPELNLSLPAAATPEGILKMNPGIRIYSVGFPAFPLTEYISSPSGLLFDLKKPEQADNFSTWQQDVKNSLDKYILPLGRPGPGVATLADATIYFYYDRMFTALGDFCRYYSQFDCGKDYYKQALDIDPSDLIALYGLGQIYEKSGQCLLAEGQYQRFLDYTPESERGYTYLRDLANNCFKDSQKASGYEQMMKSKQGPNKDSLHNF